jgi:hypothetical protein
MSNEECTYSMNNGEGIVGRVYDVIAQIRRNEINFDLGYYTDR